MGEWESLVGYSIEPTTEQLLTMANQGIVNLRDFGQFMSGQDNAKDRVGTMPWANYGITKDEYASASNIYRTEYKKVTGEEIGAAALKDAFQNPRDSSLISGSRYQQQLMNDAAIQKQFGWVKYGLDFQSWTQQKISIRGAFGRDIQDSEAATILQYHHAASGPNMAATARGGQRHEPTAGVGVSGSVAR